MNIKTYDVAMFNYIKEKYDNTVWGTPTNAFKNLAMTNNEKVLFPLMTIYRSGMQAGTVNFPLLKRGNRVVVGMTEIEKERILPLILTYELDLWARDDDTGLNFLTEVLFSLNDSPTVSITSNDLRNSIEKYVQITDILDNSDLSMQITRGRVFRYTIMLQLDAHIAKIEKSPRIYIKPTLYDLGDL